MGWDIVSIGTHHKLPINKPGLIAEKLVQLIKNPIELGYFEKWTYNPSQNKILHFDGIYPWVKIKDIPYPGGDKPYKLVDNYANANLMFKKMEKNFDSIKFEDKKSKEYFLDEIKEPYAIFELENDVDRDYGIRILKISLSFQIIFLGDGFNLSICSEALMKVKRKKFLTILENIFMNNLN